MISLSRSNLIVLGLSMSVVGLVSVSAVSTSPAPQILDGFDRFVKDDGSLHFSREVAAGLVHLGTWYVPTGDAAGFHQVYTQPEAISIYRDTGRFPDGTALVKEIVSVRRANYTTGADVASATETRQWFLMVKDGSGRFGGHPLWGDGWGWGLFLADDSAKNVATDYRADCLGCHTPARASDWVYIEGYPDLRGR